MNLRLPIYAGLLLTLGCSRDEARTYRLPKEAAPAPMHGTMPAPGPMTGSPDLPPPPSEGGL
ncbi:MAG: hypothetical protein LWX11_01085, partial [Firmicutes bacterium]|nr:hypothetical protein [Bacillota bacterium]